MPSQRPSAAFEPISPGLNLQKLVEETPNFEYVTRISCDMIEEQGHDSFDKLVLLHVILGGKPLVIEGFNYRLDEWTFTSQWLQDNSGNKFEQARNLNKQQNMPLSIGHYLSNMSKLTDQWTNENYKESDRQRIYLKDIDCPQLWHDKLKEQIPPSVFYLNESTGEYGGPGSVEGVSGMESTRGQGVARAGDLMSVLPSQMRAENMMCYIGHEGTYTPAHREMCASLGQNLMVEASGTKDELGKPTKPGSSIWFMTETNDRHTVSEYWLSRLGHDIEVESHFAQINAWKLAPFKTYIVDQRPGDFILIPPLALHQVWNRGTRTMKAAWNRTTVETLEMAVHEALPRARMVCRDEQYKNKAIVYFALQKYSDLLRQVELQKQSSVDPQLRYHMERSLKIRQLQKDFRRLFSLYTEILSSEMLAPVDKAEKRGQYLPYDSFITCSYCRCNIFNRFLTCTSCINILDNGEEDTYDICMDCFVMGRSCWCLSKYKWVEQFPWQELIQRHELWRQQIIKFDSGTANIKPPEDLATVRKSLSQKTLAQICHEQLKVRPWQDPKKPSQPLTFKDRRWPIHKAVEDEDENDVQVDDEGRVRKTTHKKSRAERLPKAWAIEHVSHYPEIRWKLATCTKCDRFYSYGGLYRMFDLMPQQVMENSEWECPACSNVCSCGACRRRKDNKPYEPKGTVLGHDTRKVADPRSVDSLVNFGRPNLHFIKMVGDDHPHENRRLSRRKDEAERAKAQDPALNEHYVDDDAVDSINGEEQYDFAEDESLPELESEIPIDPMLAVDQSQTQTHGEHQGNGGIRNSHLYGRERGRSGNYDPEETVDGQYDLPERIADSEARSMDQGRPGEHFISNGITYQYPDPTTSGSGPSVSAPLPYNPVTVTSSSRRSEKSPVQSDAVSAPVGNNNNSNKNNNNSTNNNSTNNNTNNNNTNNSLGNLTQLEKMLEDAKHNDQFISTEAAFTGKSLRISFRFPMERLRTIANSVPRPKPPSLPTRKEAPILLQSDYSSASTQITQAVIPKKRKIRKEDDGEFATRKRLDRNSDAVKAVEAKDTRRKSATYKEISSDSDLAPEESNSFVPINTPGRRPGLLPRFLAAQMANEAQESSGVGSIENSKPTSKSRPKSPQPDPVQKFLEDNQRAKIKVLHWGEYGGDGSSDSSEEEPKHRMPKPNGKLMATPKSIFSRAGPNGKKIRIVSAKSVSANSKNVQKAMSAKGR